MFSKQNLMLLFFVTVGIFLHFYNLLWGSPYFFHPDERNIVYSLSQLSFPNQLNPHFFAYGSLPIYLVYTISIITSAILHRTNDFAFLIFWLRFFSALLSSLSILSVYFIGKKLWNREVGLISAFLTTFSVGFIQFAHFGTFEMWTTFFSFLLFYTTVLFFRKPSLKNFALTAFLAGILLSIKVSNAVLILIPLLCLLLHVIKGFHKKVFHHMLSIVLYFLIIAVVYCISNPYTFLDFKDFYGGINYESSVALGSLSVFYTGSFLNTIPIIFQFTKVYPFLVNPLLTIVFIPAICFVVYKGLKQKLPNDILLVLFYLVIFLSQATLFVKWTRYIMPTLPFLYLIVAVWIEKFSIQTKKYAYIAISLVVCLFTFSYVKTVYFSEDTRVVAAEWARTHIPSSLSTLIEPYDLGALPFNSIFTKIQEVPSYNIDQNPQDASLMQQELSDAKVFIVPSQRLIHSRISNPHNFPLGNKLYSNLLSDSTDYKKVYETPCDIFCKMIYMGDPLFNIEETAAVFDRPTVMIFEKASYE